MKYRQSQLERQSMQPWPLSRSERRELFWLCYKRDLLEIAAMLVVYAVLYLMIPE